MKIISLENTESHESIKEKIMTKTNILPVDANGVYGKPAQGRADFNDLSTLMEHADRLNIDASLVWNIEAQQNHSLTANEKLLNEIEATPGAETRVVPELVVSGLILYERDGIKTLENQMKRGNTRALRYVNALRVCSLSQIEPVISALTKHKPFIVMKNDEASAQEIFDFAGIFPNVPIILTEVIWGPFIKVLDLMRRRPNIMVESSWLHTTGVLEIAVKHFGADRIVFGTGFQSHNGAAIAELARADIPEKDKLLIARGNIERLLGRKIGSDKNHEPSRADNDSLWTRFLDKRPMGVEIIDSHAHIGPSAGYVLEEQQEAPQAINALKVMDSVGISTTVVSGLNALLGEPVSGNDLLEKALSIHGDQFKGYVGFNPIYADELVKHLDRWFSGKFFVGFKTLCSYWQVPITDIRFKPMWEYANEHCLPVLMHTWGGSAYDAPVLLKDIVKQYPDISFLFGHSGGSDTGRRQIEELAPSNPNVFMEWCGSFCSTVRWEDTIKKIKPAQIVFGSDTVPHSLYWELGRLLSMDAPDSVITPILGENMRRILERRR